MYSPTLLMRHNGPYTSLGSYRELTYEDFLAEVFLEHIIGDRWEGFIKDKLGEKNRFSKQKNNMG